MKDEIKEILNNFDNAINELPKTNNIASSFNEIKVEDLREALKRFKHIPSYDELLKENKELKSRIEKAIPMLKELNIKLKDILNIGIDIKEISDIEDTLNGRGDK